MAAAIPDLELYTTCPPSTAVAQSRYLDEVERIAGWSEDARCRGMLIYTDNSLLDPWLLAEFVIRKTSRLNPLVAVQPVYIHPYAAAKMITTLAFLYGRSVDVNIVAGGFRNDLIALGDETPHDDRYDRVIEYGTILAGLLDGERVTLNGAYYRVHNLRLRPILPPDLRPKFLVSGSSPAGLAAARTLGATPVKYPKPPGEEDAVADAGLPMGARVGVVARADAEEAWQVARQRFPDDRRGQLTHELAVKVSDSHWHRQLSERHEAHEQDPYWLWPFQNYRTFCPYFVGSYSRVAVELGGYVSRGFTTFVLDVPASADELEHTQVAFREALAALPR